MRNCAPIRQSLCYPQCGQSRNAARSAAARRRLGNDECVFRFNEGADTITDFVAGGTADAVQLAGFGAGFDSFAEVIAAATQVILPA